MFTKNIQVITPRDPKTNMNFTSSSLAADTDLCFFFLFQQNSKAVHGCMRI